MFGSYSCVSVKLWQEISQYDIVCLVYLILNILTQYTFGFVSFLQ